MTTISIRSLITPFPQFNFNRYISNPNFTSPLSIQNSNVRRYCHRRFNRSVRVLEHGAGVLSPADDVTEVSGGGEVLETDDGVIQGFVETAPADEPVKRFDKKKVNDSDEDGENGRFKMRNGREVCDFSDLLLFF